MPANAPAPSDLPETATANLKLSCEDWEMQLKVSVPTGPTTVRDLLPLAQSLTDAIVRTATSYAEAGGEKVSCCAGCGACCRQLVPITVVEAHYLREVVDALSEPRRTHVLERFAAALRRLDEAGLMPSLRRPETWTEEEFDPVSTAYFELGIPCPFLEHESCSIYPDRPLVCREFLVTSPAENCKHPTKEGIRRVRMPLVLSSAIAQFRKFASAPEIAQVMPLVLALEWAASDTTTPESHPGPELLASLVEHITASNPLGRKGE